MEGQFDYTIGTLDVLQTCDACADMGMADSVIVQCADCVVFLIQSFITDKPIGA